jgi:hypothetical protein
LAANIGMLDLAGKLGFTIDDAAAAPTVKQASLALS